jgi:exosome complex component RRP45
MRPPSPSIPEKEFLNTALKQNLRLDGRSPLEMRKPTLVFGPELGWVECSLGKTRYVLWRSRVPRVRLNALFTPRVVANVEAKMVKPTPERPFEGIITIHSEISPMASSEYEPGR